MSLNTGKRLHIRQGAWTVIPISADVVRRVKAMALRENQSLLRGCGPIFEWSPGVLIDGEDVDVVEEVEHEEELLPAEDEDDSVASENGDNVEDEVDINIHDDIEGDEDMEITPAQQDEDMVVPEPQPDEVLANPTLM